VPTVAAPISEEPKAELPLVPALLCIYGAGAVSSIVAALWLSSLNSRGASALPVTLAQALLSAAVGAIALRALLPQVTGFAVSLGAAFVALSGGAIVSSAAAVVAAQASAHSSSPPATVALSLGTWLAGALIAIGVLQRRATAVVPVATASLASDALAATIVAADKDRGDAAGSYATAARAACETALSLVAAVERSEPAHVAAAVVGGLPLLQAATERLAGLSSAGEPGAGLGAALQQLLAQLVEVAGNPGLNVFDLSESSAVAAIRAVLRDLA
jgi:predicted aconitase with swiveling domain